ncbi:hypothetical protein FSST1_001435 [Fusarium sambucinum]
MSSPAELVAVTSVKNTQDDEQPFPANECDMCAKILQVFRGPAYLGKEDEDVQVIKLGKIGLLLDVKCPHTTWLRDKDFVNGPVPHYETHDLLFHRWARHSQGFFGVSYRRDDCPNWNITHSSELVFRPEIPKHPGTVRILDESWIDINLVKKWPSRCIQIHEERCNKTVGDVPPFKPGLLIDVIQGCIAECQEARPRFITLSYTWGESKNLCVTKSNLEELQKPGALRSKRIAMQLAATILDAIELTRALDVRWLWVDSLCVLQDDDISLQRELAAMHLIYATSFLTIIAADGEDAEYGLRGLRGISKPRFIDQRVEPLAQGERLVYWPKEWSAKEGTKGLMYHHRMWTSQEYHFSKRRLIFEDGQATWQCNHAEWTENHLYNPEHEVLRKKPTENYIGHESYLKVPSLDRLSELVGTFNWRTLRFGEDVYNAFSGYNTYLNSIFPHGLVYGHPELFFDISLCWKPSGSVQRRTVSARYTGDPLRTGLPSWSWMGWEGQIQFPDDGEGEINILGETGFTEAVTDWYAMEYPGSSQKQPIHSQWSHCRKAPPGSMNGVWRCEEYKPPELDYNKLRVEDDYSIEPESMPKEIPHHIYHFSLGDTPVSTSRWYPIPLNLEESGEARVGLHSGFQYLWCQTFRAYLTLTHDIIANKVDQKFYLLKDQSGIAVGALLLHDEDDSKLFQQETRVELIAIAKGWTVVLSCYGACNSMENETETESGSEDEETVTESLDNLQMEECDVPRILNQDPILWIETWNDAKTDKQDCYHVLWIEWKDGVAYRKSSGFVLEEEWEKVAEVNRVDVTLG